MKTYPIWMHYFKGFTAANSIFRCLHACYATASCGSTHSLLSSYSYLQAATCSLCWALRYVVYTGTGTYVVLPFDILTITVSFQSYMVLCVIDSVYVRTVCIHLRYLQSSAIKKFQHNLIMMTSTFADCRSQIVQETLKVMFTLRMVGCSPWCMYMTWC